MRLLVITNLYPPQELGGYGRSIADFAWGLQQRGHQLQVLTSDAPYLGQGAARGPSGELVCRQLQLLGSYQGGLQRLQDPAALAAVQEHNQACVAGWLAQGPWDGVLVGNLDLLGPELLQPLLQAGLPVQHHVGFVSPPFALQQLPQAPSYQLVPASEAVRAGLLQAGFPVAQAPVVYPGARCELFGPQATGLPRPLPADGSPARPLKVGFAGLLMGSKGPHTLLEALVLLQREGYAVQATLAGAEFQPGFRDQLQAYAAAQGLGAAIQWPGQLQRPALARLFALQHVGVFPSIHPEAFGIVAAEIMASGLVLVSSGVGGAAELLEPGVSGLFFEPGNSSSLAAALRRLLQEPGLQHRLAVAGQARVQRLFSVQTAAAALEQGFAKQVMRF